MSVLAHEGQSLHSLGDGILHAITSFDHLLAIGVVGAIAAFVITVLVARSRS